MPLTRAQAQPRTICGHSCVGNGEARRAQHEGRRTEVSAFMFAICRQLPRAVPCRPATLPATAPHLHGRTVGRTARCVQLPPVFTRDASRGSSRRPVRHVRCRTSNVQRGVCAVQSPARIGLQSLWDKPCEHTGVCRRGSVCVRVLAFIRASTLYIRAQVAHSDSGSHSDAVGSRLGALGPALVALRAHSASHLYRQDSLPCTATAENTGTANNSSVGPVPPSRRRYRQVIRQLSDDNVALRMSQQSATLQAHSAAPLGRLSVLYPLAPSHGPRLAGLAPRPLLCRPLRFRVSECTLRFASGIALG